MRLASATDSWVADTLASPQRVMRCSAASPVMVSPPSMQKHSTISPPRISSTPADSPRRGTTMPSPTAGASAGRTRARPGSEWNTGVPSGSAGRELERRIELTVGLRLIILDRFVKAFVLLAGGVVLMVVTATGGIEHITEQLQTELNLDPGRHLWLRLAEALLQRFTSLSRVA